MGHRLITALIFLNVMGFLACVALIAAAISKDDAVVLDKSPTRYLFPFVCSLLGRPCRLLRGE
jgi:hypothetical protein